MTTNEEVFDERGRFSSHVWPLMAEFFHGCFAAALTTDDLGYPSGPPGWQQRNPLLQRPTLILRKSMNYHMRCRFSMRNSSRL